MEHYNPNTDFAKWEPETSKGPESLKKIQIQLIEKMIDNLTELNRLSVLISSGEGKPSDLKQINNICGRELFNMLEYAQPEDRKKFDILSEIDLRIKNIEQNSPEVGNLLREKFELTKQSISS